MTSANLYRRLVLAVISVLAVTTGTRATWAGDEEYERFIRPLFARRCAECHAGGERSGGFSIANLADVIAGGKKHGPAVVGGKPERSPLVKLLRGKLSPRMPKGGRLTEEEIARVEAWVSSIAVRARVSLPADGGRWTFQKPARPALPNVRRASWVVNPIDAFILMRLEAAGLQPAPQASQRALARRVYLDLLGMPPTPEEMDAFLRDQSPRAYENLIDKLLADSRYGERWGRHWLDLARYGETSGLEGDGPIGNVWRYRDWVVKAFNDDMAYDQFVIRQLAGVDERSKTRLNYQPDPRGHVPTGFLRLAPWDRSNLVAAEVRQNYLNEVTDATGSVFLGLTIGCAQCHDHKYDPIPTRDFYRFQAFFSAIQAATDVEVPFEDKATAGRAREKVKEYEQKLHDGPESRELDALLARLRGKLIESKKQEAMGRALTADDLRLELKREAGSVFNAEERARHADLFGAAERTGDLEEQRALETYESTLMGKLKSAYARPGIDPLARFEALTVEDVKEVLLAPYSAGSPFIEAHRARFQELSSRIEVFRRRLQRWQPTVLTVQNVPGPPNGPDIAPTRVLFRGDYRQPGQIVEPGFPSVMTGHSDPAALETDRYRQFPTRGRRMTLARWIASPDNPLTARVMVNRIWQYHFGRGIVATPSDFGKNGQRPTHPELLDWLALYFIEGGWHIKPLHRLILLSNTYRQGSENPACNENHLDPENALLWRFNRQRLEAEVIRDSILSVSGRLNREMGGPSIFPPLPDDLADFARYGRTGELMWEPNEKEEDGRRRSIYIFQRRSLPLPMLAAFDATVTSESCPRRSSTTTPLQALTLMNGSLVIEESAALARCIEAEVGRDRRAQITRAFMRVLNRTPDAADLAPFLAFHGPLEGICRVLLMSNEFLFVD
jgi:mono/diheme cytochrome c family protein